MEYAAEASYAPVVSIRRGRWKFTRCALDPDQLFDLEADPQELHNLTGDGAYAETQREFSRLADEHWDLKQFDAKVRRSQQQRLTVYEPLPPRGVTGGYSIVTSAARTTTYPWAV